MSRATGGGNSRDRLIRKTLRRQLDARHDEIEQTILARIYAIADPTEGPDSEYVEGLRAAVSAALVHSFAAIELGAEDAMPVPTALLTQARLAASSGVSIDTVLRRYVAGYAVLGDYLMEAVSELSGPAMKHVMRGHATLFDRIASAITREYSRVAASRLRSDEQRRAERVKGLLEGETVDVRAFDYELDGFHIGAIGTGDRVPEVLRELAATLDRRLLLVPRGEQALWAWLGGRRPLDVDEFKRVLPRISLGDGSLALGEPGHGLVGWRLTHRQASAAMRVAARELGLVVRYSDVALVASILRDDLAVSSLHQLYLRPLEVGRDQGATLRRTLRAYFAAERNSASAAAALGITRQTVNSRLRLVEQLIGRSLASCLTELDAALRVHRSSDQVNCGA
jgi:hypothetical protein